MLGLGGGQNDGDPGSLAHHIQAKEGTTEQEFEEGAWSSCQYIHQINLGKWARIDHLKGWVYLDPSKDFFVVVCSLPRCHFWSQKRGWN